MKVIKAVYEILGEIDGHAMLKHIEQCARTCYKSEDSTKEGSHLKIVKALIARNHTAMLEFSDLSVKIIADRAFSHELVRMRLCSFAQESQRYCSYDKGKFGNEITFIQPIGIDENSDAYKVWYNSCEQAEKAYLKLRDLETPPEIARDVLPNSCKTEIVIKANLRQWRHVLKLRAQGVTGRPHPAMLEIMIPLLEELKARIPVVFDDIEPYCEVEEA